MALEDLKRYQHGNLALELAKSEQYDAAGISLEKLALDMGSADDAEGFIRGTQASPEGIATASAVYGKKYQDVLKESTMGDLWSLYSEKCDNEGEKTVYGAKINQYSTKKLEELTDSLKENQEKLDKLLKGDETTEDKEIIKINSQIKSYQEALSLLNQSQELYNSFLMQGVQEKLVEEQRKKIKTNMRKIVGLKE